ncbi:MAG: ammonium transporter [Chloroflexi bacterium]|nr:ammonium transporter [Chloroflexota bacterium]
MHWFIKSLPRPRLAVIVAATGVATAALLVARPSVAYAAGVDDEAAFVFNTFSFLIWGALVMWMCAGFTMLESGSVRTKNASMICLKNIGLYSIAALAYFFVGYNLMYTDLIAGVIGTPNLLYGPTAAEVSLLGDPEGAAAEVLETGAGYSAMSDWFFQMVFVATAASIVSGALAERVKVWSFFLFVLLLTAIIYPIVGAWTWGGGWLKELGFSDFAGSTIVHSTGGWAALAGLIVVGPRLGKFRRDGTVRPTPPSNILVVTLGVFILWFGWIGFNGGSQLGLASAKDAVAMSVVIANTNLAAAAGVIVALLVARPILGRIDLFAILNGAIAGLVSITARPDITEHYWAVIIGAIGGLVVVLGLKLLEKIKLDDVVGAVPAHLFAGIWGTLAVSITGGAPIHIQLLGIVSIGAAVFAVSLGLWKLMDLTIKARVSYDVERLGQDAGELRMESYPEFVLMPDMEEDD